MNEAIAVRLGPRFVFVNILPTLALAIFIGSLVAAGAPSNPPTWQRLESFIGNVGWLGAFYLVFATLTLSVVLHPLSYPLIQILEGYWQGFPLGRQVADVASARYQRYRAELGAVRTRTHRSPTEMNWLPKSQTSMRPTELGNIMQAGEVRAGERYGYRTRDIWPALSLIMPAATRSEVSDTRNQLDAAVRLCTVALLAVPTTLVLLWSHGVWLFVPLGCYIFAWAAYRAAVAAAYRFCDAVGTAVDLHHLHLWDALSLERPPGLGDEQEQMAPLLCKLLRDGASIDSRKRAKLVYALPQPWPNAQVNVGQQQPSPPTSGGVVGA